MTREARRLLTTESVALGVFRCPASDPSWATLNNIGPAAHVVFPGTPVRISRGRRGPQMADSNWAVLYQPDQDYRRHLVHPAGDVCAFVEIGPALLADLVAESDDVAAVFAAGRAPVPASAWLQVQLAVAADGDRVATESRVIDAVGQVVRGASRRTPGRRRPPSSPTVGYRVRRRIEDACELLASDLDQQLSLTDLARRLQVSPYHLARQFRERTGRTVHAYREQARLRAAGSAFLTRPDTRLAELAASLGFSSHSHLTTRFSRAFGLPPSRLRALAGAHVTT